MKNFDFSRQSRLLNAGDYQKVFDNTCSKAANQFLLILATPSSEHQARLGLIIAKKNVRRAVDRNRVKRLVRESFRHKKAELSGFDIVVMARRGVTEIENEKLLQMLDKLWYRLTRDRGKPEKKKSHGSSQKNR